MAHIRTEVVDRPPIAKPANIEAAVKEALEQVKQSFLNKNKKAIVLDCTNFSLFH